MVDDLKSVRDSFLKAILSGAGTSKSDTASKEPPLRLVRELVHSLASIAGKGKDEIVQIISREIGMAVAGVLKEPLVQILKDRQLKVVIQLEPADKPSPQPKRKKAKKSRKT